MGLFTTNDHDFSGDDAVNKAKASLAQAKSRDVTQGFGLSQGAVSLGDQMAQRAQAGGDYGLSARVDQSGSLMGPQSQQAFNAGLGGNQDQNLQAALQKRFNKGFQREAQGLKSKAQLEAQSLRAQDLDTSHRVAMQQQAYGSAQRALKAQQDAANKQARSAVLGGILGGAGAIAGTLVAPGVGTAVGAQVGSAAGGAM